MIVNETIIHQSSNKVDVSNYSQIIIPTNKKQETLNDSKIDLWVFYGQEQTSNKIENGNGECVKKTTTHHSQDQTTAEGHQGVFNALPHQEESFSWPLNKNIYIY